MIQNFISTRYTKIKVKSVEVEEKNWEVKEKRKGDLLSEIRKVSPQIKESLARISPDVVVLPLEKTVIFNPEKTDVSLEPSDTAKKESMKSADDILDAEKEKIMVKLSDESKICIISDDEEGRNGKIIKVAKVSVLVPDGAKVKLVDIKGKTSFFVSGLEIEMQENSELRSLIFELSSSDSLFYEVRKIRAGKKSRFFGGNVWNGSGRGVVKIHVHLEGEGSEAEDYHVGVGRGKRQLEVDYLLSHSGEKTKGYLIAREILYDNSWLIFIEDAKIHSSAVDSDSYVEGRAIVFSEGARSYLVPSMEIDTNEVKAKHSASVGKVGEKELFYVMSRGLDRESAEKLIVEGFLEEVISRFPDVEGVEKEKLIPKLLSPSREILL